MAFKKEGIGERGKIAQQLTEKYLKKVNDQHANFAYERLPDARAAGGHLKKQLCDYLCWFEPYSLPLEVKSTEHDYRISKDAISQLPLLKKVRLAGGRPYVLVLFKTIEKWRVAPIDYFAFGVPSWDMRDLPLFDSAEEALSSTGFFPKLRH